MGNGPQTDPSKGRPVEAFQRFFRRVVGGSFPLFFATILALVWANVSFESYHSVWHSELSVSLGDFKVARSLVHWIDDALMAIFFFVVGLEIKREILVGELASFRRSLLPVAAALGGMVFPAGIYMVCNYGMASFKGWGIPMATDIAFSLAVLAALGKRIPFGLKIFLSAFAIADDLGAVMVIAVFYTDAITWSYLLISSGFVVLLLLANLFWIRNTLVYALLGIGLWYFILGSGVHATVAGVLLAMFIPARGKYDTDRYVLKVRNSLNRFTECDEGSCGYSILLNKEHLNAVRHIEEACHDVETPMQRLEHGLNAWVSYLILPLFALANAGLSLKGVTFSETLLHPVTLGIVLGLLIGKPVGITLMTYLASKALKAPLSGGVTWTKIMGAGILGGIGFTMSLFISGLSFGGAEFTHYSKLGILLGSLIAALLGLAVLYLEDRRPGRAEKIPS